MPETVTKANAIPSKKKQITKEYSPSNESKGQPQGGATGDKPRQKKKKREKGGVSTDGKKKQPQMRNTAKKRRMGSRQKEVTNRYQIRNTKREKRGERKEKNTQRNSRQ